MDHKINGLAFDTLKQSIGIDSHLGFIEDLLRRHEWDEKKRTEITLSVNNIQNKEQDPNLYLGIIGAFSSGKSTFINALIRDNLLRTDVLPATTASATILRYGADLDVEIMYRDGTLKSFKHVKKEKENLKAFLHQVTADEDVAKEVEQVTVYHPSEFLKNNMVIVDTPGTDVNNERHIQVTGWSIREICDAAIIVIPADRPVSQTLTHFLVNHLSDVLHRCVFVVTKIDLIRHRERESLLKYIESRLKSELKLEQPMVFASTPLFILDELTGIETDEEVSRISREDKQDIINQSLQTEKEIYRILQEKKLLILLERLSNLLSSLFGELKHDLQEMEKVYLARHQTLEKKQKTDMALYVKQQKDKHHKEIRNQSIDLFKKIEGGVGTIRYRVLAGLRADINEAQDDATIRSIAKNRSSYVMQQSEVDIQGLLAEVFEMLCEISHQQLVEFENDFKVLYKSLATLDGQISVDGQEERNILASLTFKFDDHSTEISELIESDLSDENWAIGGGIGAGALIGTIIFPGVGTVVGGIIGAILGANSLETTDQLREKYWDKLQNLIDESFYQTEKKTMEIVRDAVEKVSKELDRSIDRYFEQYDQKVREMIARDEAEAAELKQRRKIIQVDLDQLEFRQQQLSHANFKINHFIGGDIATNIQDPYSIFQKNRQELMDLIWRTQMVFGKLKIESWDKSLAQLNDKVKSEHFKVMVLGEFKRGKSTVINAMLGEEVLPSNIFPGTAVINEVKWGEERRVIVHFRDPLPEVVPDNIPEQAVDHIKRAGSGDIPPMDIPYEELERYVVIPDPAKYPAESIAETPYEKVELFWPLELCENGVEIIDSPGLNDDRTQIKIINDYIPSVDAVLFVISCMTPVCESEMKLIDRNLHDAGHEDIFFICNHFDQIRPRERDRMVSYVQEKLRNETSFGTDGIFFISALDALDGRLDKDDSMVEGSGILKFEESLTRFLTDKKAKVKILQPARELANTIQEVRGGIIPAQCRILEESLEEVENRDQQIKIQLEEVERELNGIDGELTNLIFTVAGK